MTETLGATLAAIFDRPTARWNGIDSEVHVPLVGPATDLLDDVVREAGCSVQESWHAADALYLIATAFETEKCATKPCWLPFAISQPDSWG